MHTAGRPQWTPKNYAALAREGYAGNVVGYRAVRMVAEAAASVPLLLHVESKEVDDHPLLSLLHRPNAGQTGRELFENLQSGCVEVVITRYGNPLGEFDC